MNAVTGKVVAGSFALAAFAVGIISGLASENPAAQVLSRALMAMLVCYPIGWVVGLICERVVNTQIESHVQANPAPDSDVRSANNAAGKNRKSDSEDVLVI